LQGEPDRVPMAELLMNQSVKDAFLGRPVLTVKDDVEFWYKAGYDYVGLRIDSKLTHEMMKKNAGIQTSSKSSVGNSANNEERAWATEGKGLVTTMEELGKFPWPDKKFNYQNFKEANLCLPEGMKIIARSGDIFTHTWEIMGFEHFSFALVENPELIDTLFNKFGDITYAAFEGVMDCPNLGAIWYSDDIAYTEGLMASPMVLRKYLFPWMKKIGNLAKKKNIPYIYHTDGKLWEVMEDMIDCGINAIQPMEPKSWDAREVKKKYGDRLCMIGNVELDRLSRGTPEEIDQMVKECIKNLAPGGGYCVGSSNTVADYVPVENYKAMIEASFKYGKYPIKL
ncbi:MAG: uroporphyrinogen decarboxylase family protein, partial [Candidatus Firestonebacteria bacterium]